MHTKQERERARAGTKANLCPPKWMPTFLIWPLPTSAEGGCLLLLYKVTYSASVQILLYANVSYLILFSQQNCRMTIMPTYSWAIASNRFKVKSVYLHIQCFLDCPQHPHNRAVGWWLPPEGLRTLPPISGRTLKIHSNFYLLHNIPMLVLTRK